MADETSGEGVRDARSTGALADIARALGVTVDAFLGDQDDRVRLLDQIAEITSAFTRLPSEALRRDCLDYVRSKAGDER